MLNKRFGLIAAALGLFVCLQTPALALENTQYGPTPAAVTTLTRTLKRGCRGSDVKVLQTRLKSLGYFKSVCDGVFGSKTEAAVKAFQRAKKLTADGIVGRVTRQALFGSSSGGSTDSTPPASPSGSTSTTYKFGALNNQVTLVRGSRGANVKDLQTALKKKGFFRGKIDSYFGSTTRTAVVNFQRSVRLHTDGVAGNYTLSALYTLLNPPDLTTILPWQPSLNPGLAHKIEKPSWSTASGSLFKRGMNAVIVDVRTGYSFTVRRTGGSKHADVEPLKPLDTAAFFKSVGNFSWDRRPIWVIVGNHRLAASMNGMPHGYDTLANNDMKGQFCIHFVGSRTHGSNRVDPDHQRCINEAYQAGLRITSVPTPAPTPTPTPTPSPTVDPTVDPSATATAEPTETVEPTVAPEEITES